MKGNDRSHFNQPTDVAVSDDGSFYVSDGYGNSRIVKFSPEGTYLFEWGKKGSKEGEFNLPHAICLGRNGLVYVADRENKRIQAFDTTGKFMRQWKGDSFGAICSVFHHAATSRLFAVDDLTFLKIKHRGSDVFILDTIGTVQTRFGRSAMYQGPTS